MRVPGFILLLCLFPAVSGLGGDSAADSSIDIKLIPSAVAGITNIAGCLGQVRAGANESLPVRLGATVTLVDPERGLMVLQDDSAAMAVPRRSLMRRCGRGSK